MEQNILYKIYYGHKLVFVGTTNVDLTNTLRVKFFGPDHLDVTRVSKVEYITLPSMADCPVYQALYINAYKPLYNKSGKARDELSEGVLSALPEFVFQEYDNAILMKWERMISNEQISLFEYF